MYMCMYSYSRNEGLSERAGTCIVCVYLDIRYIYACIHTRGIKVSLRARVNFFFVWYVLFFYLGIRYTYPRKEGVSSREGTCRVCVYLGIYMHVGMYTYPPNEGLSSRAVTCGVYKKENIHDKK